MDRSKLISILLVVIIIGLGGISIKFYLDYMNQRKYSEQLKRSYNAKIAQITQAKQAVEREKERIQSELSRIKKDIATYKDQIDSLKLEKKKWEEKYNEVLQDKVSLKEQVNSLQEALEEKKDKIGELKMQLEQLKSAQERGNQTSGAINDSFWADIVQKKAELETKVEELENLVREKEIARKEAVQKKLELEIKLSQLDLQNQELKRQLDYAHRMIDLLSRDFVREKENRRAMKALLDKIEKENQLIKDKVVGLTKSETYLQKKLSKSQQEKELLRRHLEDMDTVIRESIEQIASLTDKMKEMKIDSPQDLNKAKVVDLPPIVVGDNTKGTSNRPVAHESNMGSSIKTEGKILNVNEAHNFVVIDLGKKDGVVEGMEFDVVRNREKIARVKVRMLKDDVCAADIVKLYGTNEIKVGDKVQ